MAGREFDQERMLRVARMVAGSGRDLDSAGATAPGRVDAGPYAQAVAALVKVVLDNSSELVARLHVTGAVAATVTANVAATDAVNADEVERIHRSMESD